ncbi:MAG: hypothetical protein ACOZCL_19290 [Bacillota bacterium]
MKRNNIRIATFLKLFVSYFAVLSVINLVVIVFRSVFGLAFFRNYGLYSFASLVFTSFLYSLIIVPNFAYVRKVVRIDNKSVDSQKLKDAMERMEWKIKSESSNSIIYVSLFSSGIWNEMISINFTDMEMYIYGPKKFVKNLIILAGFTYEAYDVYIST